MEPISNERRRELKAALALMIDVSYGNGDFPDVLLGGLSDRERSYVRQLINTITDRLRGLD